MNPLVSVVVTTYNQASYLEQTLTSVFAQTYHPYEVIVVDDGSTDDTPSRVALFMDRIIYVRQENQGVAGSRNTGIHKARGEYIAFLDGDDLWYPEKLSIQVAEAIRHPRSGLIVVDGVRFEESGTLEDTLFIGPACKDISEGEGSCYHMLLQGQFISTTSQVMVPARVFGTVGLSDRSFRRASDYDLYIRIAEHYDFTVIKKRLCKWRYLPTSASGPSSLRFFTYLLEDVAILKKHRRKTTGNDRNLICGILEKKLADGIERIYRFGLETDRGLATRYLLALLAVNPMPPIPALFLGGLWCPDSVKRRLAPTVRRILLRSRYE